MDNELRLKELERRRRRGARLLEAGVAPAEVARPVGVSRQAAWRRQQLRQAGSWRPFADPSTSVGRGGCPTRSARSWCSN